MPPPVPPPERKKRTIQEIRDSKTSGEKMVYMSVPDYTSARWAEMAGVDVAVVGDSLAMVAHGYPNTIPATMDMMVLHAAAVRRGAPNTFVLGCMPYQSYNTVDRALVNATRFASFWRPRDVVSLDLRKQSSVTYETYISGSRNSRI